MEIHISFQDGPIEAEIEAGADDDYQEVLNRLSDFVEQYDVQTPAVADPPENQTNGDHPKPSNAESVDSEAEESDGPSEEVTNLQDFSEDRLYRVLKTGSVEDDEIAEFPEIIGDVSVLGDSEEERALHGAVVLLTALNDFHDVSRVKTSDLMDALADSGIERDAFSDIDQVPNEKVYVNRRGTGGSATTKIRHPGKQEGRSLLKDIIEESL